MGKAVDWETVYIYIVFRKETPMNDYLPMPKLFKWLVLWAMIVVIAASLVVIWAYLPDFIDQMAKLFQ